MSDTVVYLAYACMHQDFYEDDHTPSHDSERVIDADSDPSALRNRLNVYHAQDLQVRGHRGTALFITPDGWRSNTWHNNGGGCMASGYVEIRKAPRLPVKLS